MEQLLEEAAAGAREDGEVPAPPPRERRTERGASPRERRPERGAAQGEDRARSERRLRMDVEDVTAALDALCRDQKDGAPVRRAAVAARALAESLTESLAAARLRYRRWSVPRVSPRACGGPDALPMARNTLPLASLPNSNGFCGADEWSRCRGQRQTIASWSRLSMCSLNSSLLSVTASQSWDTNWTCARSRHTGAGG